jgi:hypothetical protein
LVEVGWTDDHHDEDELDFPNEDGDTTVGRALGTLVLWNKADIVLYTPKSVPNTSQPSPSPQVAQVTTTTTTAAMAMIMMAAMSALHIARVQTHATHKEVQGVNWATKHHLQARAKGNVHSCRRNQKVRGTNPPPNSPTWNGRCGA